MSNLRLSAFLLGLVWFLPTTTVQAVVSCQSVVTSVRVGKNPNSESFRKFKSYIQEVSTSQGSLHGQLPSIVDRGFGGKTYSVKTVLEGVLESGVPVFKSWKYSRYQEEALRQGFNLKQASSIAEKRIFNEVKREISENGLKEFTRREQKDAVIYDPSASKNVSTMFFAPAERVDAIYYAKVGLWNESQTQIFDPNGNLFILRARSSELAIVENDGARMNNEFHVLSHVPINSIEGVFIGFPLKSQRPKSVYEIISEWLYLEVKRTDDQKNIMEISLFLVEPKWREGFEKRLEKTDKVFTWSREGGAQRILGNFPNSENVLPVLLEILERI